ncbi:uncharacterized protein EI97DRAFT_486258, partial [Westerdykella ornata]
CLPSSQCPLPSSQLAPHPHQLPPTPLQHLPSSQTLTASPRTRPSSCSSTASCSTGTSQGTVPSSRIRRSRRRKRKRRRRGRRGSTRSTWSVATLYPWRGRRPHRSLGSTTSGLRGLGRRRIWRPGPDGSSIWSLGSGLSEGGKAARRFGGLG